MVGNANMILRLSGLIETLLWLVESSTFNSKHNATQSVPMGELPGGGDTDLTHYLLCRFRSLVWRSCKFSSPAS